MKGTYILLIKLGRDADLGIGSLGKIKFRKGFYAYVGSGMNSLEKRIGRHTKRRKKKFWHIDYFLGFGNASIKRVVSWKSSDKHECRAAGKLAARFENVTRFGCSDCACGSHLFYSEKFGTLEKAVLETSQNF
jgi:Uri superfamily endonuclease